ncbi:26S proteasome non-ATPase regulatory subunit 6 [Kappamyces sp. JEL0680]|nr:26S proteasome non-ATPase regulatory subunit 6 [Kappamyces sp. JEL0680]
MGPFYKQVCAALNTQPDASLAKTLDAANETQLKALDDKIEDAITNLGETEHSDALIAKALYLAQIGDKDASIAAYEVAFEKTAPVGYKIDILFCLIRIGFFHQDNSLIDKNIVKVKTLIEKGGDWDRRNRLKVYEGLFLISKREFKEASSMLLDTLATFTSTEMLEYKEFVNYAVLIGAFTLSRPDFKTKVLNSPEILECIHQISHLSDYASSFYNCQYATFFKSLAELEKTLKMDVYLHSHYRYYVREMRIRVYSQILESYKSVTIKSLATSFGVTEEWIDGDLAQFISAGRLNAVIDKVAGVVETNRPDAKNAQYQQTLKDGDNLLNSIQKLSRVINV